MLRLPRDPETYVIAGGAALGIGVLLWKTGTLSRAATATLDFFQRGDLLTSTKAINGIVPDDPDDLVAAAANVLGRDADLDLYAMARMGRSEGTDGMEYRMHVAWNDLADLQRVYGSGVYSSISALMLHSKVAEADGHFSDQGHGKRYATTRDPYVGDYELAEKVAADRDAGIDLAQGAIKFADKDSFGVQAGTGSYEAKLAEWEGQGLTPFNLPGASDNFVLFRRA